MVKCSLRLPIDLGKIMLFGGGWHKASALLYLRLQALPVSFPSTKQGT